MFKPPLVHQKTQDVKKWLQDRVLVGETNLILVLFLVLTNISYLKILSIENMKNKNRKWGGAWVIV